MVIPCVRLKIITVLAIGRPDVLSPTESVDRIREKAVRATPCKLYMKAVLTDLNSIACLN